MVLALDLAVVAIIAFCGWRGYKNGLIRGVFGIVSLVVSLFLASVAATAYSGEFKEMLSPFVGGFVDSALGNITDSTDQDDEAEQGSEDADDTEDTEEGQDGQGRQDRQNIEYDLSIVEDGSEDLITAYTALRKIGLPEASAALIARQAADSNEEDRTPIGFLSALIAEKLSSALAYAAVFGIAFILLAIVFTVIGNLIGFVFSLPGLKIVDIITGVLFGLAKGLVIVYALAVIIRYLGLLAPGTLEETTILKYIVNNNPIAERIGI